MKKITLFLLFGFLMVSMATFAQQRNCAVMDDLDRRLQEDPQLELRMQQIENYTQEKIQELSNNREINGDIITIPVVVHVLYNNSTTNISDAQIQSQIDVLNEDFRRTNSDADNTWSQAADSQIEFCLATVDPNGNTTTGITRKSTSEQDWYQHTNDMKKSAQGGIDPWDTSEYLNMWTVPRLLRSNGDVLLGFAQFPGGDASTDGVVMGYNYFGRIGQVSAPFDLGRTTTHEVGHFLNLRHIWGDGGCSVDDFVSDTPTSDGPNYGCNPSHVSCSTTDMVQNYMDYSDDSCMNLFSQGQVDRMRVTLLPGGVRASLGASSKCGPPPTPTCTDGIQNGNETGVDCGGPDCAPCPEPTCTDGIQNGNETGVDCGGPDCDPCQIACSSTISSFPYDESFENTLGAWTQDTGDDFNWTVRSGSTPSSNTGPSGANDGSYYVYMESSSPNYSNKRAILNAPCLDLSGATTPSISFKYHMYGSSAMGSLALEASIDDINWTTIWSRSGNQGNAWLDANVDLSAYNGSTLKLRFNGVTGTTWQGDMAIDKLNVITFVPAPTCDDGIQNGDETGVDCGGSSCAPCPVGCANGENLPYSEGYETSIGLWTQDSGDDLNWTRDRNGTPSSGTGPSSGSGSTWYIYVEASGNGTGYPNKQAIINSPCLDLTGMSSASFDFNYHMYGSSNMGTIDLEISTDDGNSWTSIWNESGNKGNSWLSASIDLSSYVGGGVRLRFNRVTGGTWKADIAIDNISVTSTGGSRAGNELSTPQELVVYPNPVRGSELSVELVGATNATYRITNTLGQTLMSNKLASSIDVGSLNAGIYFIIVDHAGETYVKRFIKE
ncbi:M43 family zinc metalloprotease [Aureisphaera galaxeae]|uniref:M43 family zinc metalloprotease n=1 Tax=Aureisphaera galaxeae TaxID=1538023 RepID=UPI0023500A96|nr:M43 family zinc metalloprotease [Aureisphaera galaxeae]MDC8002423.1 M43 family zinc metalloprotease [Aureisphaera galaxeae]